MTKTICGTGGVLPLLTKEELEGMPEHTPPQLPSVKGSGAKPAPSSPKSKTAPRKSN